MINLRAKTIPIKEMRYETVGDYWTDKNGVDQFRIAEFEDDEEFAILIHELLERYLCKKAGITNKQIDDFDMNYKGKYVDECGNDPKAPYHEQHRLANKLENFVRKLLR